MSPASPATPPAPRRHTAREAVALVARNFEELPGPDVSPEEAAPAADGPLGWDGYDAARARAHDRTGESESVVCGTGRVDGPGHPGGTEAVLISFEFGYLGGSLGERTGDRIEAAHELARERRLPVLSLVATGGSRMQEGMRALTQLQRVARQTALTRRAGLPQLAVVRDPATGGGWATLAAGADVVLALPGAQAGFAGSRVRPAGADPYAYTAEGQHAAGHIDRIVPEAGLAAAVGRWLALLTGGADGAGRAGPAGGAEGAGGAGRRGDGPAGAPAPVPYALTDAPPPRTGTEAVARARSAARPRAEAYLDAYFEEREEISGDRCGGVDDGVRCGFGRHGGRTVAYAAQCGTATRPAGYRTAARLVRTADRLGLPVLTLIDTPGAANDAEAEQAGAGPAIADLFTALAEARTPVTSLLVGEGGSGGALALAAPGRLWVTPDSYFSVIAPELAAAILKRAPDRIPATADALRLRPQDAVALGVARGVTRAEGRAEGRASATGGADGRR